MAIVSDETARDALGLDSNDVVLPLVRNEVEQLCKDYVGWELERTTFSGEYYPITERGGAHEFFPGDWGGIESMGGRTSILQLRCKYVLASGLRVYEFAGAYMGQYGDTDWEELTLGEEYALDLHDDNVSRSGHVRRLGSSWPKQRGSVKVTYTAGFTATELSGAMTGDADHTNASAIRHAVLLAIMAAYNEIKTQRKDSGRKVTGTIVAESVPDYSYRIDPAVARQLQGMTRQLPMKTTEILDRYSNKYSVAI